MELNPVVELDRKGDAGAARPTVEGSFPEADVIVDTLHHTKQTAVPSEVN